MAGAVRNSKPLRLAMKYFARAHIWAYRRTNGRVGARLLWFPAALVTTTGRKTGRPRTTPTLYLGDGDRVVLPASFGGRDADPGWYRNLKSNPEGQVKILGDPLVLMAHAATDENESATGPS